MGTRGLRIVRFRGRYWCFYNHWDSYFKSMGNSLVESVPTDPVGYKKWLQALRELFAKWDALLQDLMSIEPDSLRNIRSDKSLVGVLDEAFDARLEQFPTSSPGFLDLNIGYTYTFDLDHEVFSIDNSAHFHLQHIPRNSKWIEAVCLDDNDCHFAHPRLAPEESLASLAVDNHTFSLTDLEYWKTLSTKEVTAKASCEDVSSHLRLKLFDIFKDSQIPNLRVTLLSWTANDLVFRELAFFILCLAADGDYCSIVDVRRILKPTWTSLYGTIVHGEEAEGDSEFISSVGNGFHLKDQPISSAPSTSKYWFNGALVCLVARLDQDGVMEKAVADAIRYGREACKRTSFNALLISVAQLVLIRSVPDGSVQHSPIMPLISTAENSGQDARTRYGKSWLDTFYDREMIRKEEARKEAAVREAKRKTAQGSEDNAKLTSPQSQSSSNLEDDNPDEGETLACTGEQKQLISGQSDTDVAMQVEVAAITLEEGEEATARDASAADEYDTIASEPAKNEDRALSPGPREQTEGTANNARIDELADEGSGMTLDDGQGDEQKSGGHEEGTDKTYEEVEEDQLGEVDLAATEQKVETDDDTWQIGATFLSLINFLDSTILDTLKPTRDGGRRLPTEITEMILGHIFDVKTHNACTKVSRVFRSFCLKRPVLIDGVRLVQLLPESEDKADRRLHVLAEKSTGELLKVAINETGYSSGDTSLYRFVVGKERNRRSFCPGTQIAIQNLELPAPFDSDIHETTGESYQRFSRGRTLPEDSPWDRARHHRDATANSDIKTLSGFYEYAAKFLFPDSRRSLIGSVFEDHHQDWLLPANTKQLSIMTDDYDHKEYERYLLLRIKRASKYWDCLWDDIIGEVKALLIQVDEDAVRARKKVQLIGAANPAVILAVGFQVRLFEWDAGDATLTETNPGRLYSVMDEDDRKTIEAVLTSAVERLETAELKE
ncbi:MAG: hypothetical protein Q9188_002017 [Gyalolechia gomerana]